MTFTDTTAGVRKAAAADAPDVSATLSAAFYEDPVLVWSIPDPGRRRRVLPGLFDAFVWAFQRHDETFIAGDGLGVALWAPPGVAGVADEDGDEFGRRIEAACPEDAARIFELSTLMEAQHPHEPCWHLQLMGVDPAAQGQGLGSTMFGAVLPRADADRMPAYLEATTTRNRALYQRHGFETVGEIVLPEGPSLWPMWRRPRG